MRLLGARAAGRGAAIVAGPPKRKEAALEHFSNMAACHTSREKQDITRWPPHLFREGVFRIETDLHSSRASPRKGSAWSAREAGSGAAANQRAAIQSSSRRARRTPEGRVSDVAKSPFAAPATPPLGAHRPAAF
ncbi:hypothetical protein EVAR_59519_1 [Eumeta japonica]|uniref:Uncharacterized protein n=1 Tax=Eumeta variegata TaxID=151549 RepID=A0A4C1XV21_EUMVA|nr:hypothetical protein EVAR_59519_1 [Eumeta japonica]